MSATVIVSHVSHTFQDGQPVLDDVSLAIPAGGFVALVGQSGVGKSTLLRIVAGLVSPLTGQVSLQNGTTTPIGIVFQQGNLMPWRTAYENVHLPLELLGENGRFAPSRVQEMLDLVGLAGSENSYPAQLSGGMAQRVALARALVHQPSLLLLDEPFGALDALTRERMGQELLRIWHANPVTVLLVTHSIHEAVLLADEVLVMGRVGDSQAAQITARIVVELPRPRRLEMQGTAVFQDVATAVRDALERG